MAAWGQAPPTIRVVTRDRDEAFAKAIAAGAPDATQVAVRFHPLPHLGELLERLWALQTDRSVYQYRCFQLSQ